jgi:hypothetical protein
MDNPEEIRGPISFVASLIASDIQKTRQKRMEREQRKAQRRAYRQAKPPVTPAQKAVRRALTGSAVAALGLWLSPLIWNQFAAMWQSPRSAWVPVAVWAFVTGSGLFALWVGLKEAGLSVVPNRLGAFWAAWGLLGLGWLLLNFVPLDPSGAYAVRGGYATCFAVLAVYVFIASGLAAANARRVMRRQLKQRNVPLRPARPRPARRWFFLWLW